MLVVKYIILSVVILPCHLISAYKFCETRSTCEECIRDPSVCVWCAQNDFNSTRCKPQSSYEDSWCPGFIQNPVNNVTASDIREFSSDTDNVIQIKPQSFKLKLRPGVPSDFTFSFQAAKDFPVDLYFLLDASKTMQNITNMTAEQSENIYLTIQKMTSNVYLGLGTFVDKRVLPFTTTFNSNKTYSFRHRLKLGNYSANFQKMVLSTPAGANRDDPEGGLDALAQVMICQDIIGWRNESRKIIIFMTDGEYHAAGDGKSAGLFQPYDGKCYTKNNEYTKELEMDYPSAGMINKLATEHDMTIIFVIKEKVKAMYQILSSVVSGSKLSSYNEDDIKSKNDAIVKILEDIYKEISKKIKLKLNMKTGRRKNFEISFQPDCTVVDSGSDCDIEVGKEQKIVGTVKLLKYDGTENAVVDIVVEGIGEKLTLDIEIIKSCDCDSNVEEHSKFCNGENRTCGLCSCSNMRYGEQCACIKSKKNIFNDNSTCIAEGSTSICSDHGSCHCGTCSCRDGYEGNFCQCSKKSCPWDPSGTKVCNGRGNCYCGKCDCHSDWYGDACECYKHDTYCIGNDNTICNNRGRCICGACKCDTIGRWDARDHQDRLCKVNMCQNCHEQQCLKLEDCARCRRNNEACLACDVDEQINTTIVKTFTKEYLNSTEWNVCDSLKVDIGCYSTFVYRYNDASYSIDLVVTEERNCAETYYMFGGIFLLTLLIVGAVTLIAWKLLTNARDRQEYVRFMQQAEIESSRRNLNPLYQPATTVINNPGFRKASVDVRL